MRKRGRLGAWTSSPHCETQQYYLVTGSGSSKRAEEAILPEN